MPKEMERKLKAEARKKGLKGEHADAYVYGTMRKTGWQPKDHSKENAAEMHKMKGGHMMKDKEMKKMHKKMK